MTYKLETYNDIPWTPTITGLGSCTEVNFTYRRLGRGLIYIVGTLKTGSPSGTAVTVTLPSGMVVSSALADSKYNIVGHGHRDTSTTSEVGVLARDGDSTIAYSYIAISNTNHLDPVNGDTLFSSSERVSIFATVPVNEV
ncbi:hypothetical protein [Caudoviricetes sp.]|nr:hypothetical protein [Caudoviricetes sp.]